MTLWTQETYVNATENYIVDEGSVQQTFTDHMGELFRFCRHEFGRCTTRVYVDRDGQVIPIGWVFIKRVEYEDADRLPAGKRTYLQETWITVHDAPPTRTIEYHYHQAS